MLIKETEKSVASESFMLILDNLEGDEWSSFQGKTFLLAKGEDFFSLPSMVRN